MGGLVTSRGPGGNGANAAEFRRFPARGQGARRGGRAGCAVPNSRHNGGGIARMFLLVTFCNQGPERRRYGLAAAEPGSARFHWVAMGRGRKDVGATGFACQDGLLFVSTQSEKARLVAFDTANWRRVAAVPFAKVRDPHSLVSGADGLYIASSGDNAIYRLVTKNGELREEELVWRHPGTSHDRDDVHVNSLGFAGTHLLATGFGPRNPDGTWNCDDGFVFDVTEGRFLARGLDHPHSFICQGERAAVSESRAGRVRIGRLTGEGIDFAVSVPIPGYPRGLTFDGPALYAGTSMMRKYSRSRKVPVDAAPADYRRCAIWRIDTATLKAEEILDCSDQGTEIYEIGVMHGLSLPAGNARPSSLASALGL